MYTIIPTNINPKNPSIGPTNITENGKLKIPIATKALKLLKQVNIIELFDDLAIF